MGSVNTETMVMECWHQAQQSTSTMKTRRINSAHGSVRLLGRGCGVLFAMDVALDETVPWLFGCTGITAARNLALGAKTP